MRPLCICLQQPGLALGLQSLQCSSKAQHPGKKHTHAGPPCFPLRYLPLTHAQTVKEQVEQVQCAGHTSLLGNEYARDDVVARYHVQEITLPLLRPYKVLQRKVSQQGHAKGDALHPGRVRHSWAHLTPATMQSSDNMPASALHVVLR